MRSSPSMQLTLKQLRLSGIAESLETRLDQAREASLGYLEFLQIILQDEVERRHARGVQRRLKQAAFQEQKGLEEFDFQAVPGVNPKEIKDLATGLFIDRKEHVILYGPPGTGKTHLAQALGNRACRNQYSVLFTTAAKLFRKLAAARIDSSYEEVMRSYLKPQLLIIDDLGLTGFTQEQTEAFYEIVAERHHTGSIVITSNRPPGDWPGLFPDQVLANSLMDRLAHKAHHLPLKGDSYRKRGRPQQTTTT
jgi:DNA replication protein DnaC